MASLDLYYLLVEKVFGSVFLSGLGIAGCYIVLGMLSRMSALSMIFFTGLFLMTFFLGYFGGFALFLFGILAMIYFFNAAVNFVNQLRGN